MNLFKYGHASCTQPPHLTGGLAEYIYLKPGTAIFKIPDTLALVTSKFSLREVDEAFKAAQNKMVMRVAVIP